MVELGDLSVRSVLARMRGGDFDTDAAKPKVLAGMDDIKPGILSLEEAKRCQRAVAAVAQSLPKNSSEELMARHRMPRNRSEALLRGGACLETVFSRAALVVVERWARILRPTTPPEELPTLISVLVHGSSGMTGRFGALSLGVDASPLGGLSRASSLSSSRLRMSRASMRGGDVTPTESLNGGRRWSLPGPSPPLVPPSNDSLGLAMRHAVPKPAEVERCGWEFFQEVLRTMDLEDQMEPGWPRTEARRQAESFSFLVTSRPAFLEAKERNMKEGAPGRRAPLCSSAQLRLSGDFDWTTYQETSGLRRTCMEFSPQIFMSSQQPDKGPGPGDYRKEGAKPARRGEFPSVGSSRIKGGEHTMSTRGRFFFAPGDP